MAGLQDIGLQDADPATRIIAQQRAIQRQDQAFDEEADFKNILSEAGQLVAQGGNENYRRAFALIAGKNPQLAGQLAQGLEGIDPDFAGSLAESISAGTAGGQFPFQLALQRDKAKNESEKPVSLSPDTKKSIRDSLKGYGDAKLLQQSGMNFLKQGKAGLFTGTAEIIKDKLGLADPNSTEFQGLSGLIALSYASEANEGKPTDKDFEQAKKFLASPILNPESFKAQVELGAAKFQTGVANTLLLEMDLVKGEKEAEKIREIAQRNGIDLDQEQKINEYASARGLSDVKVRQKIIQIKSLSRQELAKMSVKKRDELIKFQRELKENGINF